MANGDDDGPENHTLRYLREIDRKLDRVLERFDTLTSRVAGTAFPFEVLEEALAHTVGSKSSRSYARSDLLAERAKLMKMWSTFCGMVAPVESADVVPMRAARS